jgi:very-short-patch-repair endonuclease
MGKKVIIVGDHEQVSPDAVGQESNIVQALQQQFLDGIPNANLYDGKLSLYDMSRWGADGILSLKEHFRCMPSIIGFSNQLSYGGRIKPLRDSNSSNLLPVIPLRVEGVRSGKQKTNPEEAIQIVALIKAMCENSAYTNSTIGVISLLGTEQATYIEVLIHKHISTKDIEKRQIICGNAAQFQGDERDIIFLSMVDSNEGDGPIRKQGEGANDLYKKRYNVAASRAKNQMWVVHSMDYQTDLKPDDIRRQLLDYCYSVSRKSTESIDAHRTDSEFERLVLKELLQRGYQVTTQYEVGAYRIDMVVEYEGRRLAIECDGEKWHSGTEKIAEDFARQAILERLGWKFHRIRGSCFFRERASAIQKLIDSLNELDIQPKINTIVVQDNLRENSIHQDIIRIAESFLLEIN